MILNDYLSDEEIKTSQDLFIKFHDKIFLDDSVKNPNALLISIYMVSNKKKSSLVNFDECQDMFTNLGRKKEEFSKALYELKGGRKGMKKHLEVSKDDNSKKISLNIFGIKRVRELLRSKNQND